MFLASKEKFKVSVSPSYRTAFDEACNKPCIKIGIVSFSRSLGQNLAANWARTAESKIETAIFKVVRLFSRVPNLQRLKHPSISFFFRLIYYQQRDDGFQEGVELDYSYWRHP